MTGRAELIAKTQPLTETTLIKEIFGFSNNTFKIRNKKKHVLKQLHYVLDEHKRKGSKFTKEFIIYCFIKLWHEGNIYNYDFDMAWLENLMRIVWRYKDWYDENNIEEIQQTLVLV